MILTVRKDFMVFEQYDLLWSDLKFRRFLQTIDAKAHKKIKTMICHVWKYCKDPNFLRIYCLRRHVHAWIHPSIKLFIFFNGFLSDPAEITSCEYTKTVIYLRLS